MSVFHDHDCENCHVYQACGWFGDILVKPRCFVDDACNPDIQVPDLTALQAVVEDKELVLVPVSKADIRCVAEDESYELVAVPMEISRGPSAEAISQVNENPDLVLVAVDVDMDSTIDLEVEKGGGE